MNLTSRQITEPAAEAVDISMCLPINSAAFAAVVTALALIVLILFRAFKITDSIRKFKYSGSEAATEYSDKNIYERLIPDVEYLKESIRLAEQYLAELSAAVFSFEKKSLAVITGAVAIAGYTVSEGWCMEILNWVKIFTILCCLAAVVIAGFVVSATDLGISGANSRFSVSYWRQLAEKSAAESDKVAYLYLAMLEEYEKAIGVSIKASAEKSARFTLASYLLFIGFCSAVSLPLIKWLSLFAQT